MCDDAATRELTADDLPRAATMCRAALSPAVDRDWAVPAGDLEWSCRRTLDHMVGAPLYYAGQLATGAHERIARARAEDTTSSPAELLGALATTTAILAALIRGAPTGARGWHPAGMADGSGFIGMACNEVLVHTFDVTQGLGVPFAAPSDLAARVVRRLYPWAPTDGDGWATLLWAAGRAPLGDRERQAPDWFVHCAPLAEWDGTIKKRPAPPPAR